MGMKAVEVALALVVVVAVVVDFASCTKSCIVPIARAVAPSPFTAFPSSCRFHVALALFSLHNTTRSRARVCSLGLAFFHPRSCLVLYIYCAHDCGAAMEAVTVICDVWRGVFVIFQV